MVDPSPKVPILGRLPENGDLGRIVFYGYRGGVEGDTKGEKRDVVTTEILVAMNKLLSGLVVRGGVGSCLFAQGFLHYWLDVFPQLVSHLLAHELDPPADALGIVFIEVPKPARIGESLEALLGGKLYDEIIILHSQPGQYVPAPPLPAMSLGA